MKKPRKPRAPNTAPPVLAERRPRPRQKNSEIIYADLRAAISGLDLPPGTALSEQDLAQRYGVSRTPVREAILRLSEVGWSMSSPSRAPSSRAFGSLWYAKR